MRTLLIVYHSQSGSCARLARAAADGAGREQGVACRVQRCCDAGVSALAACDGVLLVAAENSGSVAGGMKDFLDRIFYPAIDRRLVLPAALLVSAGNDGNGAVRQVRRILSGIPFTEAAEPLIVRGEVEAQDLVAAQELGQGLAAGIAMGIF